MSDPRRSVLGIAAVLVSSSMSSTLVAASPPTGAGEGTGWEPRVILDGAVLKRGKIPWYPVTSVAREGNRIWAGSHFSPTRCEKEGKVTDGAALWKIDRESLTAVEVVLPPEWFARDIFPIVPDMIHEGILWIGINDGYCESHADDWGPKEWIGGDKPGGLFSYDLREGKKSFITPLDGLGSSRVYSVLPLEEEVLIWGYYPLVSWEREGLSRLDRKNGKWSFAPTAFGHPDRVPGRCRDILAATSKHVWFGAARRPRDGGAWEDLSRAAGIEARDMRVVRADGDDIWIGGAGGRIVKRSETTATWKSVQVPGLEGIVDAMAFEKGHVFIGAESVIDVRDPPGDRKRHGGGLFALDRSLGTWTRIPTRSEPVFDAVYCLLPDEDFLWAGTKGGLLRLKIPPPTEGR